MMQVQKGNVEYAGRKDIVITYGQLEDGKQYYFIDGGDLGNGNYIATTKLLEAISSKEEPKNLGVINSDGVEVVPFENKSIKIIKDKYLLVVLANPVSQSVIDVALEKEKVKNSVDSLATSGLITTATAIKESVGTKMALDNGRFIFNDQASEATIYDYDGNNVLNGEYYSFVGLGDTGFYLSKNVVNSPVVKFDFEKKTDVVVTEEKDKVEEVSEPVEDSAKEETVANTTSVEDTLDLEKEQNVEAPVELENEVPVDLENVDSEKELDVSEVNVDQGKIEEALNTDEIVEEIPVVEDSNQDSKLDIESDIPVDLDNKKDDTMKQEFDFKLDVDDYNNETNYSDDNLYNYKSEYYEEPVSRGDSILPTAISTMNNLIKQNRDQKEKIEVLDSRNNGLKEKIINFENTVSKLEGRNQLLERENRQMEDKLHSQSEVIERQNREISSLREKLDNQRRSEADLANLLRTAQGVLTQDNNYSYSDDQYTYSKVA